MDRTQRLNDLPTAISIAMRAKQGAIWTALPGIIESYDAAKLTCSVQPAIQGVLSDPKTGDARNVNLPLLVDCPVIFPSGGGVTFTFPIKKDDECLVIFASRCIDAWWQSGGVQAPMVYRMHDLSDGFVIVGPRSQANLIPNVSTTSAQIRSNDGLTSIELNPNGKIVKIKAPAGVTIDTPQATFTGNVSVGTGINASLTTSTGQTAIFQNGILTTIY